jgi:hypothetical protein
MTLAGTAAGATPPSATHHGTWDSADICGDTFIQTGIWNVNLKTDGTASVSTRPFLDGRLHAAWGGNAFHGDWVLADAQDPVVFLARQSDPFGAGIDLLFELRTGGVLRYSFTNDCEDGSAAVLYGHLAD